MGRKTSRPSSTIRNRPPAAGSRVKSARPSSAGSTEAPLWARAARTVTVIRMGATATSCASRTAKVARPVSLLIRPWAASTGMTTAVEDRARPMPSTAAPARDWPRAMKTTAMARVQTAT
ncbi:hypothetical protein D3C72_1567000 [compost metagenome]